MEEPILIVTKFYCERRDACDPGYGRTFWNVVMRPDFPKGDSVDHPNKKFWEATPSGQLNMQITNETAAMAFEPGRVYTVTFSPD